ncbi:Indole-3-glycerol phosphate synthase [uncultured archaeon]|nr:Indole-3-glycerol phosphate synthase [uncultured archaeon]
MSFLDDVVASTRERVRGAKEKRNLTAALESVRRRNLNPVIAEYKPASPGKARRTTASIPYVSACVRGGAAAISVLTEPRYFQGRLSLLSDIKSSVPVPVMRKDFILDEFQLYEAAAYGADAVLIMARILRPHEIKFLVQEAFKLNLTPIVEVDATFNSSDKINAVVDSGSPLFGVNSRDLSTLQINPNVFSAVKKLFPPRSKVLALSGVSGPEDARRLMKEGAYGLLVGNHFMDSPDPAQAVRSIVTAAP